MKINTRSKHTQRLIQSGLDVGVSSQACGTTENSRKRCKKSKRQEKEEEEGRRKITIK